MRVSANVSVETWVENAADGEFKNAYPGKCAHREIHACHVPGTVDKRKTKQLGSQPRVREQVTRKWNRSSDSCLS